MKHDQVMIMKSANSQANITMGMHLRIHFMVGEINLHCMVQVFQEVPLSAL